MSRRKAQNIITDSDYEELKKSYKFIIDDENEQQEEDEQSKSNQKSSWKDRMVQTYHSHLYKTHVIADLTQYKTSRIGLRWRTEQEVMIGKGVETCGNKHCPSYDLAKHIEASMSKTLVTEALKSYNDTSPSIKQEDDEWERLRKFPYGVGLHDYEVHFAYEEQGEKKEELVKLRLCLRCAPMLFYKKGGALGALMARQHVEELDAESLDEQRKDSSVETLVKGSESTTVAKRRKYMAESEKIDSIPREKRKRSRE
jgi:protein FRA10AC1